MFGDYIWSCDWLLEPFGYEISEHLLLSFDEEVVAPAKTKARKFRIRRWVRVPVLMCGNVPKSGCTHRPNLYHYSSFG
jgi:hypothetical protein